jgi:hypothetical protein
MPPTEASKPATPHPSSFRLPVEGVLAVVGSDMATKYERKKSINCPIYQETKHGFFLVE